MKAGDNNIIHSSPKDAIAMGVDRSERMKRTRTSTGRTALAVLGLLLLAGCDLEKTSQFNREFWRMKPAGYNTSPLGVAFDTPAECRSLRDEKLRNYMTQWFELREQYLREWRRYGEHGGQVERIQNRRIVLQTVIQDYVTQLRAGGVPLTGGD